MVTETVCGKLSAPHDLIAWFSVELPLASITRINNFLYDISLAHHWGILADSSLQYCLISLGL